MSQIKFAQLHNADNELLLPRVSAEDVFDVNTRLTLVDYLEYCKLTMISKRYPIGSLYWSTIAVDMEELFPGTQWEPFSEGRVMIGAGAFTDKNSVTNTFIPESTSNPVGTFTDTITIDTMANHSHSLVRAASSSGREGVDYGRAGSSWDVSWVGGTAPHNNMMQAQVIYIYKRVA